MDEFALMFYIILGWFQINWLPSMVVVVMGLVLYATVIFTNRGLISSQAFVKGLLVAVIATFVIALMLPTLTDSSLTRVNGFTDWMLLFLMSAGFGSVVFVLAYPVLVIIQNKGTSGN